MSGPAPVLRHDVPGSALSARLTPFDARAGLSADWLDLQRRADCSFFQSWAWIGAWIEEQAEPQRLQILEVHDGNRLVALAALGSRTLARHGFVRSRALLLHETGAAEEDRVSIEYNSLLSERGFEVAAVDAAVRLLAGTLRDWDEVLLSGVEERTIGAWREAFARAGCAIVLRQASQSPLVDLDAVRARGSDYLVLLSANTRQQVRRTLRAYARLGELRVRAATDSESAKRYLDGLRALHDRRWSEKEQTGAFATEFAQRLHERLVGQGVTDGTVQMLCITAGAEVVGYLYNFVRAGHVYFYQSGFRYLDSADLRPGLLGHYLAIMHNLECGNRIYDFLAGDQRYKRSLSTASANMYWLSAQRPRFALVTERRLKAIKLQLADRFARLRRIA